MRAYAGPTREPRGVAAERRCANPMPGLRPGAALQPSAVLALQRRAGNRSVTALVSPRRTLARQFTAKDFKRPGFSSAVYTSATTMHNLRLRAAIDVKNPELSKRNLAVPHRFPWKALRDNTLKYLNQQETEADFKRWTSRMLRQGAKDVRRSIDRRIKRLEKKRAKLIKQGYSDWDDEVEEVDDRIEGYKYVRDRLESSRATALGARRELIETATEYNDPNAKSPPTRADVVAAGKVFLTAMNNYYANVPDLGPHRGVNIPVRERMHLNVLRSGDLSPFSNRMLDMSPGRVDAVAVDENEDIVSTTGMLVDPTTLPQEAQDQIEGLGTKQVNYKVVKFDFGTL